LYLTGWGRSGSTLLERMLGQVDGVFAAGELREIWLRGVIENRLCGCGERFGDCVLWQKVGSVAFGGWDRIDAEEMQALRLRLDRAWSAPLVWGARLSPFRDASVVRYVEHLEALHRAIAEVTGASVIVDSSKLPSSVPLLRRMSRLDLRAVHVVRDPRGVVHSWGRVVPRPDGEGFMPRYGSLPAGVRYLAYNAMAHGVGSLGVPYERLRYEDLVADPSRSLAEVLRFAGIHPDRVDLGFIGPGELRLGPNHTVDGNPMRLQVGATPLREDDAWRSAMSGPRRAAISALTAPLLLAYGYGRRRKR
jgi:hypothetical protein